MSELTGSRRNNMKSAPVNPINSWGHIYALMARLLKLDDEKNRLLGDMASIICQQFGTEAMPEGMNERIEAVITESKKLREEV